MSEQAKEAFSSFLDDEASEIDIQRMLKELDKNPSLLEEYRSIALSRDSMSGAPLVDLTTSIRNRLGVPAFDRSEMDVPQAASGRKYGQRLLQGAIAASVAAIMVVTVQFWSAQPAGNADTATVAQQSATDDVGSDTEQNRLASEQRLQKYLQQHIQDAGYMSGHAVIPVDPRRLESEMEQNEQ